MGSEITSFLVELCCFSFQCLKNQWHWQCKKKKKKKCFRVLAVILVLDFCGVKGSDIADFFFSPGFWSAYKIKTKLGYKACAPRYNCVYWRSTGWNICATPCILNPQVHMFSEATPCILNPQAHMFSEATPCILNPQAHMFSEATPCILNPQAHMFSEATPCILNPQAHMFSDDDDDELMLNVLRCHLTY